MNGERFAEKWKQIRARAKEWWGKLTDDDLEQIGGERDKLVGLLQERYDCQREQAEEELWRRAAV